MSSTTRLITTFSFSQPALLTICGLLATEAQRNLPALSAANATIDQAYINDIRARVTAIRALPDQASRVLAHSPIRNELITLVSQNSPCLATHYATLKLASEVMLRAQLAGQPTDTIKAQILAHRNSLGHAIYTSSVNSFDWDLVHILVAAMTNYISVNPDLQTLGGLPPSFSPDLQAWYLLFSNKHNQFLAARTQVTQETEARTILLNQLYDKVSMLARIARAHFRRSSPAIAAQFSIATLLRLINGNASGNTIIISGTAYNALRQRLPGVEITFSNGEQTTTDTNGVYKVKLPLEQLSVTAVSSLYPDIDTTLDLTTTPAPTTLDFHFISPHVVSGGGSGGGGII